MARWLSVIILAWSALALSACGNTTGSPNNTQQPFFAEFDPAAGVIPFPNNVLFSGSTDGTLNIPLNPATFNPADPYADPTAAMNTLDGFSTSAPITTGFNLALDAASIDPYSVQVFEVTADPLTTAVTGITRKLTQNTDYLAIPSPANPSTLVIKPLRPLKSNTHYLIVLTNGLTSASGIPAAASLTFRYLKQATPLVDANGNSLIPADNASAAKLEGLRQLTQAMLGAAATQGVNQADVVLAWTFKTQTINKVLARIDANSFTDPYATSPASFITVPAAPSATNKLGVLDFYTFAQAQAAAGNTALIDGYAQGLFNNLGSVVIGAVKLPYYLDAAQSAQDTAPLTGFFRTDAYGMPALKSVQTVPFLLTVPNSPGPWPVVIFQHGFTVDKSVVFGIANALAKAGFAAISIDAVLHGDRTFGLDLVTETYDPVNQTMVVTANVPDGTPDSSGTHYLNLGHLLTARDNIRQSVADLIHLTRLIENQAMDVLNNTTGLPAYASVGNPAGGDGAADLYTSVSGFVGHSNGGILGTMLAAVEANIPRFVLANPGGVYSDILQNSIEISPKVNAGLAAKGVTVGSPEYAKFFVAAQTVVDDADPFNYAPLKQAGAAVLLFKQKGDRVVPNASTDLLASAFGLPQVAAGAGSWPVVLASSTGSGFVHFLAGTHSSFLKPDPYDPLNGITVGLDVMTEMQTETATFLSTGQIVITNATGPASGLPIVE